MTPKNSYPVESLIETAEATAIEFVGGNWVAESPNAVVETREGVTTIAFVSDGNVAAHVERVPLDDGFVTPVTRELIIVRFERPVPIAEVTLIEEARKTDTK